MFGGFRYPLDIIRVLLLYLLGDSLLHDPLQDLQGEPVGGGQVGGEAGGADPPVLRAAVSVQRKVYIYLKGPKPRLKMSPMMSWT